MDFIYAIIKIFIDHGPLPFGGLLLAVAELVTPKLFYIQDEVACFKWQLASQIPLAASNYDKFAWINHNPCQNALGIMAQNVSHITWHIAVLAPFALGALIYLIVKNKNK